MSAAYELKCWENHDSGGQPIGKTVYIETACRGSCDKPFRIDERHPEFAEIKPALDAGDRSLIFCYHKIRT